MPNVTADQLIRDLKNTAANPIVPSALKYHAAVLHEDGVRWLEEAHKFYALLGRYARDHAKKKKK